MQWVVGQASPRGASDVNGCFTLVPGWGRRSRASMYGARREFTTDQPCAEVTKKVGQKKFDTKIKDKHR